VPFLFLWQEYKVTGNQTQDLLYWKSHTNQLCHPCSFNKNVKSLGIKLRTSLMPQLSHTPATPVSIIIYTGEKFDYYYSFTFCVKKKTCSFCVLIFCFFLGCLWRNTFWWRGVWICFNNNLLSVIWLRDCKKDNIEDKFLHRETMKINDILWYPVRLFFNCCVNVDT